MERQRLGEEIRQSNRQLSVVNAIGLGLTGAVDARTVLQEVHGIRRKRWNTSPSLSSILTVRPAL